MESLVSKIRPTPGLVAGAVAVALLAFLTGGPSARALIDSVWILGVLLGSVLAHELSHAVVARRAGMTVDVVRLSIFGGETYYSGRDPGPRVLRVIALAGPKTSFLIAAACLAFLVLESVSGWTTVVGSAAAWGLQANLLLGAVNLLPFGSLDGAVLRTARRDRR